MNSAVTVRYFFFTTALPIFREPIFPAKFDHTLRFPPVVALALPQIAIYYRYLEESLGRAMKSQYVRTARAKGLSERATLIRHALPNALLPMLTVFGATAVSFMMVMYALERRHNGFVLAFGMSAIW